METPCAESSLRWGTPLQDHAGPAVSGPLTPHQLGITVDIHELREKAQVTRDRDRAAAGGASTSAAPRSWRRSVRPVVVVMIDEGDMATHQTLLADRPACTDHKVIGDRHHASDDRYDDPAAGYCPAPGPLRRAIGEGMAAPIRWLALCVGRRPPGEQADWDYQERPLSAKSSRSRQSRRTAARL